LRLKKKKAPLKARGEFWEKDDRFSPFALEDPDEGTIELTARARKKQLRPARNSRQKDRASPGN